MKEIILVGGGGHCKSVIDIIEQENRFRIAGIVDRPALFGTKVLNYEVIGNDDSLQQLAQKYKYAFIAAGQSRSSVLRVKLFKLIVNTRFLIPSIISPRAYISKYSIFGEGTIIMHQAIVNASSKIGKNCIINSQVLIEHDVLIGNNTHISTNANINGDCIIGNSCFIGSGAVVLNGISIIDNCIIGAGAVVTKNIEEKGIYVGIPAKKIT